MPRAARRTATTTRSVAGYSWDYPSRSEGSRHCSHPPRAALCCAARREQSQLRVRRKGVSSLNVALRTNMRYMITTILAAAVLAMAPIGSAHHSPVAFNTQVTDFELKGVIESVEMRNPHSVMKL